MPKKRFGIDKTTNDAISQTINMAKNHDSNFINAEILLSKITLDEHNPRKHTINIDDIKNGLQENDEKYKTKKIEYDALLELANSIKKEGLLHPIIVFKNDYDYKLVAGERRFFASILAKKQQIEARIFKNKPDNFDLKIIQWMENESRKDLSLHKKLLNIQMIVTAYQEEHPQQKLTAIALAKLLSISRQSAQYYLAILANKVLLEIIEKGCISQLRTARELVSLNEKEAILKKITNNSKENNNKTKNTLKNKVNLGNVQNSEVIKNIINDLLSLKKYQKHVSTFSNINWQCHQQTSQAFQKLIKLLEKNS